MESRTISSTHLNEFRNDLKQCPSIPIEAELDILKPMAPLHQWKKTIIKKDDYAVRIARLVWLIWKEIRNIWPDFHLNDYCLLLDFEKSDEEFYYINKDVGEIYKYSKTIGSQIESNLSQLIIDQFHSSIFIQYHSNENFIQKRFIWNQNWTSDGQLKERHDENDFMFFHDNICLGEFSFATALLIREWLANKCKEYHIHVEKHDMRHKISSFFQGKNQTDKYVRYLAPTDVQRIHIELCNSLCKTILNWNDNQIHLNDALSRVITLKIDYTKDWYDNNWYCDRNDGLLRYLTMNISLHATFAMNLNLRSNAEYYQLFIRNLLNHNENLLDGRIYELASIQFLTAILCDLGGEDPNVWKRSYNGRILHTLLKYGLNSSAIKSETHENEQIETFFTESIIQSYHHFSLFAKQLHHKGAKFLILPNEIGSIAMSNISYYAPIMKYLLDGHIWTKFIHYLNYTSEHGTIKLRHILVGQTSPFHYPVFLIPLPQHVTIADKHRLIVHVDQIEMNITVQQQENFLNNRHVYFVVDNHKEHDYSNILICQNETTNKCILC